MSIINETTYIGSGAPYDIVLSMTSGLKTTFNQNQLDIDFEIKGTGLNKSLFFDASTGRLGIGTGVPDAVFHVIAPCAKDGAIIESITNCPTGVTLLLIHNPQTSPQTGSIPATLNLAGRDNNYNEINYGQIQSRILSSTTSATTGEILFTVDQTGVNKEVFVASINNIVLGTNNLPSGNNYLFVGKDNRGSGQNYLMIGSSNSGTAISNSLLLGSNNTYVGPNLLSILSNSTINSSGSVAIGQSGSLIGNNGVYVVLGSNISGNNNTILGRLSNVSGSHIIGMLNESNSVGTTGILVGNNITNSGNYIIQLGYDTTNRGNNTSIIGLSSLSSGNANIIYGNLIKVSGNNIVSMGSNNNLSSINNSVVLGQSVNLTNTSDLILLGLNNATVSGLNNSVVIGDNNNLANTEVNSLILFGHGNISDDLTNVIVLGNTNNLSGTLQNTFVVGSGNALLSEATNSIIIGSINNRSGIYLNSQGETSGVGGSINANNINTISIGHNNLSYLGSSNTVLGHKNIVSGININTIGSFNNLRNTENVYVLGNSNYLDGQNIVALGKNIIGYGQNIIAINNTNEDMDVYGSGSIIIGNNPVVCSGITIGYNNSVNTVSGLVYGKNNYIGLSKHLFTADIATPNIISINALVGGFYKENDSVLLQVKNPSGPANSLYVTVTSVSENPITTQTTINIGGSLTSVNLTDRYVSINESFDDNFVGNTTISGYIIALKDYENNRFYGLESLVLGNDNNQKFASGIIVGNKNASSGINTVVIGNNISGVGDNSIHIGSSNTNKIVFNDSYLVFNTGTTQQQVIYRSFGGDTAAYFDLVQNRLGINNNNPRSSIDVSGTITTSGLRVGLTAVSGDVLTANSSGIATWQQPVRLSGTDNGLLYRVNDKIASGINSIRYTDSTNGINFYDNIYILENSGIIVNADKGATIPPRPLTIWGSGGVFAPKLLEVLPGINRTFISDFAATTGFLSGLNVVDNVRLPTALTGTLLYVDTSGNLLNRVNKNNTVLFANNNSWGSGNAKLRWFDNQHVLTLSNDDLSTSSSVSTQSVDTEYNIMLSNTGTINTVFNNRGLSNNFIVYNSGSAGTSQRRGFHIITESGRVGINATPAEMGTTNAIDTRLYVNGRTYVDSLRIGGSPLSGLYLRTAANGDIVAANASFDVSFSGIYPLRTTTIGEQLQISISTLGSPGGSQLSAAEEGKTLVFNGANNWIVGSGLQIWQATEGNNLQGAMIGYGTSFGGVQGAPIVTNGTIFGGGSFNMAEPSRLGSSQFMQYHLRTRTAGATTAFMTTNFQTSPGGNTSRSANNSIRFPTDMHGVWTFRAYVNVLWQSITDSSNMGAGGYIVEGTVANLNTGFTMVGTTGVQSFMSAGVSNNIAVSGNNSAFNSLDITVSGSAGYNMLWSSTVQINQLAWPTNLTLGVA